MAKNVKFNNKDYNLDQNKLAPIQQTLADYLTNELAGTGATIYFGDKVYSVNGTKIANATDKFTGYLNTIEGTDSAVIVGGRSYGLNKSKLADATTEVETALNSLKGEAEKFSEGLQYRLNDDGASYSVIGIGTCTDRDVVIPDAYEGLPVTVLGSRMELEPDYFGGYVERLHGTFQNCTIHSVVIPDSVVSIEDNAFLGCMRLNYVSLPQGLTYVGKCAFSGSSILYLELPNSVVEIGERVFSCCSRLQSLVLGNGVKKIPEYAFYACVSLKWLAIGSGVTEIDNNNTFTNCNCLKNIYINTDSFVSNDWSPSTATIFWNTDGSNTEKPPYHLPRYEDFTNLTFSEGLEYELNDDGASYSVIGIGTCTDRDVVIPETYNGLPVTALKPHTEYVEQKGMMRPTTVGAFQSVATIATVVLPQTVTFVGGRSFCGCRGLQTVVISNSLKTIDWEVFTDNDYGIIKVVFQGVLEEWNNIEKDSQWTYFYHETNMDILCSDDRTLAWCSY